MALKVERSHKTIHHDKMFCSLLIKKNNSAYFTLLLTIKRLEKKQAVCIVAYLQFYECCVLMYMNLN